MSDVLVPDQEGAVADREHDLFLSAGAGTGKTTVLVRRFCDAVCAREGEDADVGVENVLAFTFTERAAAELRRRIRAELGTRSETATDAESARGLRSLARDSESAWISTIHSFCQRVLGSHPIAAGLDPGFRVLDEAAAARLAAEAFDAAFERFGADPAADRFEMAAAYGLRGLRTLVRAAHDELRSRGAVTPELPPLQPPDVAGAAVELNDAASAALAATADRRGTGKFDEWRARMAAAFDGTRDRVPDDEEEVAAWAFDSKARALAGPEVERYHRGRGRLERRLVEARHAGHYEHVRELLDLYAEEYTRRKDDRSALDFEDLQLRARRLLASDPDLCRRYGRQFRHIMVDEFQDTNALQLDIVRLLEEGGGGRSRRFTVGDELQSIYGFRHADVEVFRAERRAAEEAAGDRAGVRRLGGNFRSAPVILALVNRVGAALFGTRYEPLTPQRSKEEHLGQGRTATAPGAEVLVTERRGWDDEDAPAIEVSPDERAQAWRVAEARFLAERLLALHRDGVPRGEMVVLLRSYSYVEAYEEALERMGLAPYVVGGRGYWSKQQVADVRNLLGCVANPLDDRALLGALASPACGVRPDTLWLLRRAAGRGPVWTALRRAFGPALSSPVGPVGFEAPSEPVAAEAQVGASPPSSGGSGDGDGEPDQGLLEWHRRVEETTGQVPEDDAEALREFVSTLERLRSEAASLTLEALVDRVITATGYDLALLMRRPRGRRRMANVRKLMRLAREFEADEGRDLRAFLDFTALESDQGGREAEAAVDAEGHDGVRLMTVHAAKGLEFPVVAVADLGRSLSTGTPPALRLEPSAGDGDGEGGAMRVGLRLARLGRKQVGIFDFEELEERAVEREREEERRILHVAMTRAKRQLLVSGVFSLNKLGEDPKPTEPLIAPVLRALGWTQGHASVELESPEGDGEVSSGAAPSGGRRPGVVRVAVRVNAPGKATVDASTRERGMLEPAQAEEALGDGPLQDPDMGPPAEAAGSAVRSVSYSALSLYEQCGYRFYAERVLGMRPRLPRGPAGRGSGAGSEAHGSRYATGRSASLRPDSVVGEGSDEWHLAAGAEGLENRYARGRVVHALLEQSARRGWVSPDPAEAAALLRAQGSDAGPAQVARATGLVESFLAAPIRGELARARHIHAEAPFAFRAAGLVVRGEIDLLADLGSEVLVLDYKSDALRDEPPAAHMPRYEVQRRIYALAALRRHGRPVRVAYVFLERPDEPVEARFSPAEAAAIAADLGNMAGAVSAGRFPVTSSPERSLCLDCPARERLCVHGPEMTLRDTAG